MRTNRLLTLALGIAAGVAAVLAVGWLTLTDAVKAVDRAVFDAMVPALQSVPGATSISDRVTDIGAVPVNYGMAIALGGLVWAQRRDPLRGLLIPAVLLLAHWLQRLTIIVVDGYAPSEHVVGAAGPYFSGGVQRVVLLTGILLVIARPDMKMPMIMRWAVAVGLIEAATRFVLGRHWPSDLLASFPIGLAELLAFRVLWDLLPTAPFTHAGDGPKATEGREAGEQPAY